MITKCWNIENSAECAKAVKMIEETVPCFTFLDLLEDGRIEFTISCRSEDVSWIQSMISAFV